MLTHSNMNPKASERVVILGAGGFVGGACAAALEARGVEVLGLGRADLDLGETGADAALAAVLRPSDALLVVAAKAPCRNWQMLIDNVAMMGPVCAALEAAPVSHLAYISSDAVYADQTVPMTEQSPVEPTSLHGIMHRAREMMLASAAAATPFAILRPTLIYGSEDPHNGYGPNRFRRLAAAGEEIVLFGGGEERRDHVLVDDVAEIACRVLFHASNGMLNVATGEVVSFREIAAMVAGHFAAPPPIRETERQGPMPHGGYRAFDIAACHDAFPDFALTQVAQGIAKVHAASQDDG